MAIIGALIGVAAFWSFQWGMVGGLFEEDLIWIAIIPGILAGGGIGLATGMIIDSINQKTASDSNKDSAADELLNCKKLLDAGIITQEEYEFKKAEVLSRL